jgi:hypothetical protein
MTLIPNKPLHRTGARLCRFRLSAPWDDGIVFRNSSQAPVGDWHRSATSVRRKILYPSLVFLVCTLLACAGCDQATPVETFQAAITKQVPSSVSIINSRSRAVTAADHYLHFTISPSDLAAIVQGGEYERDAKPGLDFHLWKGRPAWWTPDKLGGGTVLFSHMPDKKGDAWRRDLFVSSSSNEVYCYAAPIFR